MEILVLALKLGCFVEVGGGDVGLNKLGRKELSPIRSLIESGFGADKRSDVRLYYGARNLRRMAYQDRFEYWESIGVKVVPVLSQPDEGWTGETGYVQAAFSKLKQIVSPKSTGAVLCGHKQMAESLEEKHEVNDSPSGVCLLPETEVLDVTSILTADGVSDDKILKNY
ncbi:hypothetical protein Cgig2_031686 [Carnegiea gigantea]|uniref:Oxidoreductase FAD/NAD(P)-binding domain-containing protein n=1 Tax=Carnegiea gigantea TaxID=171969 RepID=A0A9Q1KS20_9CARY|nr:hypothetical protein Cgig2_031686 [Carnegiea gigantea]